MDQRLKKLLFGFWIVTLVGVVCFINPSIFKAEVGDSRRQFQRVPILSHPVVYQEINIQSNTAKSFSIYRGNLQRTGVYKQDLPYTMLRRTWRIDPFNHNWHQASKSTPVTDGADIFVGDDYGRMNSIDMEGRRRWVYQSHSDRGVHGSAVIVDDAVFWGDYDGILYAANKNNGSLLWMNHLGDTIGSSPLYNEKNIYISVETFYRPNGFVAKVDARNGKTIWMSPYLGAQAHSSPTLSAQGDAIYVGSNNGYLSSLDTKTGAFNWRFKTGDAIKGTPAVFQNDIYVCSWDSFLYRVNPKGEMVWRAALGDSCQSSATFSEKSKMVYVATKAGKILAFDLESGKLEWSYKGEGNLLSSGVLIQDEKNAETLVMTCQSNRVCLFAPDSGKLLASIKTDSMVTSVPMVFDRTIFLSMNGEGGIGRWK